MTRLFDTLPQLKPKTVRIPRPPSKGEETFALILRANKVTFLREYKFHPERKWRFDFAAPLQKVAAEIEGGTYSNGRHTRGAGYEADMVKYNEAALMGWMVLRFSTRMVSDGTAEAMTLRALAARPL